jgi:hypothetical protein
MTTTKEAIINWLERGRGSGVEPDEDGWYRAVEPEYDCFGRCMNFWKPGITPCARCGLLITHRHRTIS